MLGDHIFALLRFTDLISVTEVGIIGVLGLKAGETNIYIIICILIFTAA